MYNNPNFFQYQNLNLAKPKLFNFSDLLNKTQKTLNVINQAIPIFYQIKPLWNNTKTILKIANIVNEKPKQERKENVNKGNNQQNEQTSTIKQETKYNEPVFFL